MDSWERSERSCWTCSKSNVSDSELEAKGMKYKPAAGHAVDLYLFPQSAAGQVAGFHFSAEAAVGHVADFDLSPEFAAQHASDVDFSPESPAGHSPELNCSVEAPAGHVASDAGKVPDCVVSPGSVARHAPGFAPSLQSADGRNEGFELSVEVQLRFLPVLDFSVVDVALFPAPMIRECIHLKQQFLLHSNVIFNATFQMFFNLN